MFKFIFSHGLALDPATHSSSNIKTYMSILFGSELSIYCAATASFYRWQKLSASEIVLTWE